MVEEKEGLQLDQATWETIRKFAQLEVSSQARLWSDTLEKSKAQTDARLDEFQGVVTSIDSEHGRRLHELGERLEHLASKSASHSVDLHQIGATARGELRRATVELDGKITALGASEEFRFRQLLAKLDAEVKALQEHHRSSSTDLLMQIQDLHQQVIDDRAERQATQMQCMHYADRQLAAAMASKELEARFQAVRDSTCELDQKIHQADVSLRADLSRCSQELSGTMAKRFDEMAQLQERQHAASDARLNVCDSNAKDAAESADKAVRLVDESLHQKVHAASRKLKEQIEAAATHSSNAGHAAAPIGEVPPSAAHELERRSQELQAGFYGLVAREALDTEIRALVDRATRRLQVVADDLAQRSATVQEHVVGAEERLWSTLEFARRQLAEVEAQKAGDLIISNIAAGRRG